jgi:hypothetical protein
MEPAGLSFLHGDPETPVPVLSDQRLLDDLPPAAITAFVEKAGPDAGTSLLMAELRHLGGAFGRAGDGHGALAKIDGGYVAFAGGMPLDAALAEAVERDSRELMEAMERFGSGRSYGNFAERPIDVSTIYPDEVYARLRRIRARVDPDGILRANHEITVGEAPARAR